MTKYRQFSLEFRLVAGFLVLAFGLNTLIAGPGYAQSASLPVLGLPAPGAMLRLTPAFNPPLIKGLTIYPDNPFQFDFIVDTGDDHLQGKSLETESNRLIKYFLAALTVPEDEMWVNLSPYEKNRIIPAGFGQTEMGRDLLAQDYMLKQLTASLMYPEEELGKEFWKRVYEKAQVKFGAIDIPTDTFNKIWIVPDKAVVYVHDKSAFVAESHLKVMLEEDYLALEKSGQRSVVSDQKNQELTTEHYPLTTKVIKEVLIPIIEKEVNEGKIFANLRQIYQASILAIWFKQNLKQNLLAKMYVNQNKTKGVDIADKEANQKIYEQYVAAFKKGVYDYIKEDYDAATQTIIPRKYFSGGAALGSARDILEQRTTIPQRDRRINRIDAGFVKVHMGLNGTPQGGILDPLARFVGNDNRKGVGTQESVKPTQDSIPKKVNYNGELLSYKKQGIFFIGKNGSGKSALSGMILGDSSTGYQWKKKSTDWQLVSSVGTRLALSTDNRHLTGERLMDLPLASRLFGITNISSGLKSAEIKFVVLIGDEGEQSRNFVNAVGVDFEKLGIEIIVVDPEKLKEVSDVEETAQRIKALIEKKIDRPNPILLDDALRQFTGGQAEVMANGATVREMLNDLETQFPGLRQRLEDTSGITGALQGDVRVYVDNRNILFLQGWNTKIDGRKVEIRLGTKADQAMGSNVATEGEAARKLTDYGIMRVAMDEASEDLMTRGLSGDENVLRTDATGNSVVIKGPDTGKTILFENLPAYIAGQEVKPIVLLKDDGLLRELPVLADLTQGPVIEFSTSTQDRMYPPSLYVSVAQRLRRDPFAAIMEGRGMPKALIPEGVSLEKLSEINDVTLKEKVKGGFYRHVLSAVENFRQSSGAKWAFEGPAYYSDNTGAFVPMSGFLHEGAHHVAIRDLSRLDVFFQAMYALFAQDLPSIYKDLVSRETYELFQKVGSSGQKLSEALVDEHYSAEKLADLLIFISEEFTRLLVYKFDLLYNKEPDWEKNIKRLDQYPEDVLLGREAVAKDASDARMGVEDKLKNPEAVVSAFEEGFPFNGERDGLKIHSVKFDWGANYMKPTELSSKIVPVIESNTLWGTAKCENCQAVIGAEFDKEKPTKGFVLHQNLRISQKSYPDEWNDEEYVTLKVQDILSLLDELRSLEKTDLVFSYRDDVEQYALEIAKRVRVARLEKNQDVRILLIKRVRTDIALDKKMATVVATEEGVAIRVRNKYESQTTETFFVSWEKINQRLDQELIAIINMKELEELSPSAQDSKKKDAGDAAMGAETNPGGIDLNPAMINLQTKGEMPVYNLPANPPVPNFNLDGLYPVIINITPVTNFYQLLGVKDAATEEQRVSL